MAQTSRTFFQKQFCDSTGPLKIYSRDPSDFIPDLSNTVNSFINLIQSLCNSSIYTTLSCFGDDKIQNDKKCDIDDRSIAVLSIHSDSLDNSTGYHCAIKQLQDSPCPTSDNATFLFLLCLALGLILFIISASKYRHYTVNRLNANDESLSSNERTSLLTSPPLALKNFQCGSPILVRVLIEKYLPLNTAVMLRIIMKIILN